jgi:hypothetical protein
MREVERANQRDMETLPQRDLEPAEQRAYPSQSSINYVVRGERVTFIVTSGVLTAGIFGTFVATRDPWILVIGVASSGRFYSRSSMRWALHYSNELPL